MPEHPPSLILEELDVKARILQVCVEKLLAQSLRNNGVCSSAGAQPRARQSPRMRLPKGVCGTCGSGDTPGHICVR